MPCATLVYNPYAGRFPSWLLSERAVRVLRQNGWDIRLEQSHDAQHFLELAQQAVDEKMDAFFVAGGDGTVNLAVRGLVGSQTALGVLPAGTANVFAQELGLPGLTWTRWMALEESARRLANARPRWVDIGLAGNTPFLLWSGIGLDAFIIHRIEPRPPIEKRFAVVAYAASTVWHATFWHGINMEIVVDGEQVSGHYLLAVVSNIHLYAGGIAQLCPNAFLDDGRMDLWLFEGDTIGDTVQGLWDLVTGLHIESDKFHCYAFQSLTLKSDSPLYVQVDAEPVAYDSNEIQVTVKPHALRILVPESTPRPLFKENTDTDA